MDAFTDAVGRAAELGFTDAIVRWPRDTETERRYTSVVDDVADLLPQLRQL